jgi:hypothetical protein
MILTIALGVVLGVLILRFLPALIGLGALLGIVALLICLLCLAFI